MVAIGVGLVLGSLREYVLSRAVVLAEGARSFDSWEKLKLFGKYMFGVVWGWLPTFNKRLAPHDGTFHGIVFSL